MVYTILSSSPFLYRVLVIRPVWCLNAMSQCSWLSDATDLIPFYSWLCNIHDLDTSTGNRRFPRSMHSQGKRPGCRSRQACRPRRCFWRLMFHYETLTGRYFILKFDLSWGIRTHIGKTEGIFINLQCDCHRVASIFIKLINHHTNFSTCLPDLTELWINGVSLTSRAHIFSISYAPA